MVFVLLKERGDEIRNDDISRLQCLDIEGRDERFEVSRFLESVIFALGNHHEVFRGKSMFQRKERRVPLQIYSREYVHLVGSFYFLAE